MQRLGRTVLSFLGFSTILFLAIYMRSHTTVLFPNKVQSSSEYPPIVGINLGESYSQVGVFRNGKFEIITDEHGRSDVPSYVAFLDGGTPLVGFEAKERASENPLDVIYDARRILGWNFSDPEIEFAIKALPYSITNQEGRPVVVINTDGGKVTKKPEEITGLVVAKLKAMAEKYLKTTVNDTVISVPPYFNEAQRQATKDAASLGGLQAIRLVNEPTSIGIAFEVDIKECDRIAEKECVYLLYKVKEKESEIALLSVDNGVFEILATEHYRGSGGNIFDIPLETHDQVVLSRQGIPPARLVHRYVKKLLDEAKLDKKEVDGIIVTGEDKHIVKFQNVLTQYMPDAKVFSPSGFRQDQAIVKGVAIQGAVLSGNEATSCAGHFIEILPLALGFELGNGEFMPVIARSTIYPTYRTTFVSPVIEGQEKIALKIFEGQRKVASKNKLLGTLEIGGLHRLKGVPEIEISFEVDVYEALIVRASGNEGAVREKVVLDVNVSRYQAKDFDDIVHEAEKFHEEDLQQLIEHPLRIQDSVIVLKTDK